MGGKESKKLSEECLTKALEVFNKIDTDHSKTIDREETMKFWDTNYAKLNTEAIFGNVDKNKDGEIQEEEWIYFWEHVKGTGYSDEEIMEELDNLSSGGSWVQFGNMPKIKGKEQGCATDRLFS